MFFSHCYHLTKKSKSGPRHFKNSNHQNGARNQTESHTCCETGYKVNSANHFDNHISAPTLANEG